MPTPSIDLAKKPKVTQHINQIVASLAVSFGPFAVGLGKGYTSPALASLQEEASSELKWPNGTGFQSLSERTFGFNDSLTITDQQGSWVASLSLLGALFGGLSAGLIMKLGRRRALLLICVPMSLCWTLTMFASNVEMIYATAFLAGFFSAIVQLATQVYISEIAHPSIRASLCSGAKVFSQIGLLSSYAMGAWLNWRQLAIVCAAAPLMLLITTQYVPETPSYLIFTNQEARAERSLQWLRGNQVDVSSEMDTIYHNIRRMRDQSSHCKQVLIPQLVKPLFITCFLMFFQRFSGVIAFNFYAVNIFRDVFVGAFNPHMAAVVTGLVQLMGSAGSGILCDLIGRLPLLILSSLLMSLALAAFGVYSYYKHLLGSYGWDCIPLLCVVIFVCAFNLGISPISWLLLGELFPLEFRHVGTSAATAFSYICAFAGVKTFIDLKESIGMAGTFWTYALVSLVGLVFSVIYVPETRGKNLDEMDPKASHTSEHTEIRV